MILLRLANLNNEPECFDLFPTKARFAQKEIEPLF